MTSLRHITYEPGDSTQGWRITDDTGRILLSAAAEPSAEILTLIDAALSLQDSGSTPTKGHRTQPTPADLARRTRGRATQFGPRYRPIRPAAEWMNRNGVPLSRVLAILADPYAIRTSKSGSNIYSGSGYDVVLAADDETILAVRPLVRIGHEAGDLRRVPGTKHDDRKPLPDSVSDFIGLLRGQGFSVRRTSGNHWQATRADDPGSAVTFPATPSDHRWAENTRRDIKHTFRWDIAGGGD